MDAILELLARVGASNGAGVLVSEEELSDWPEAAVHAMKSQKLLVKASPSASVVCPGCEQESVMPVYTLTHPTRSPASFVVCDKRDDINRVPVAARRLGQWRCGAEAVSAFVARSLGLRPESQHKTGDGLRELGLVKGKKRSQMVCLRANGVLELAAGNNAVPLAEVVRSGKEVYSVDGAVIRQLVDTATTADTRYTRSNARREARKLETQDLHECWRKEYRALKKRRPEMSDVWYAQQIAKTNVGNGRSAETIRRHLKR